MYALRDIIKYQETALNLMMLPLTHNFSSFRETQRCLCGARQNDQCVHVKKKKKKKNICIVLCFSLCAHVYKPIFNFKCKLTAPSCSKNFKSPEYIFIDLYYKSSEIFHKLSFALIDFARLSNLACFLSQLTDILSIRSA